jgi:phosphoglycerate dehydrogenase-like enzyme
MREVHGTTWLIFGLGAIGTEVAIRARAFGARTIGCRRFPTGSEPVDEMVSPDHILEHVGTADVVVVAAPATPQTRHVIGEAFLSRMTARSILVNVARGSLVDEAALLTALANGAPETAVLDAVAAEPPPPDSPLWDHPGVVLTPHNAFAGEGNDQRNIDLFLGNLRRYVDGEPLVNDHLPPTASA